MWLGPLLFLVYINNVEDVIAHSNGYMYADDLALVVSGNNVTRIKNLLQTDTDALGRWCTQNQLTINAGKTKILWTYARTIQLDLTEATIYLQGSPLDVVQQFNYLGVLVDRYLTLGPQCQKMIVMVRSKVSQLRNARKATDEKTALTLYVQMVRPCLEYCATITDSGPVGSVGKLQTLQNDCLRACYGIRDPRDINVDALHQNSGLERLVTRRNIQILTRMYAHSQNDDNVVQPARVLRANSKVKLKINRPKKDIYSNSPLYRGIRLWDRLDAGQHHSASKEIFLTSLTHANLLPLERVVI